jgi:NADH:ubiquinone oxidoreductase subunit 6 (subunit J)
MTVSQVVFIVLSIVALSGAVIAVTNRNLFRSALALVLSFIGIAGFYILLEAELLAMFQLLVYVGAISILIIFAVMLSRRMMADDVRARNEQWLGALLATVALFAVLAFILISVAWPTVTADAPADAISQLGEALVNPEGYVLVFEVASVLLLAALVGAIVIARER